MARSATGPAPAPARTAPPRPGTPPPPESGAGTASGPPASGSPNGRPPRARRARSAPLYRYAPPIDARPHAPTPSLRAGAAFAIGAYALWGLAPFYFKLLTHIPAPVVLGHRILWSALFLALLLSLQRRWPEVRAAARSPRLLAWLLLSTALVSINWLVFIYSIETGRLADSSLGYFINPLVTVLLGLVFLGERLRPAQWAAVLIAGAGVAYLSWSRGGLPWIALVLPISFGGYGLIRKRTPVAPVPGLFIETLLVAPLALAYLAWMHASRPEAAFNNPRELGILALSGIITAVPLLLFVAGAQRLPLVILGFLQFLTPSFQLLTAILAFGEPFDHGRAVAFTLMWVAVGIFIADLAGRARKVQRTA
ncbi:MAG: EamA family transporter RarD [Phycisphaerales bacterium]